MSKRTYSFLCLVVVFVPHILFSQAHYRSGDVSDIVKGLRDTIPAMMAQKKVPGLSVAIVDGKTVLWMEGFGYADTVKKTPVTVRTNFSIQSMSKTFTALAVLSAVQDGLLDLDRPITDYIPWFTVNSRHERDPQKKMTLRLLLSHRAGFTHEAPVGNNYDGDSRSFEDHVRSIATTWLRFPVDQRYSYSNLGIDLAGYIVQLKSGKPFHQYVKEHVFDPIGMGASTFDGGEIRRMSDRAVGHSGSVTMPPVEVPMIPAGGMYSNVIDLARFLQFNLNGGVVNGTRVLRKNLLEQMQTIPSRFTRQTDGYGLGLSLFTKDSVLLLNHTGGGFGFLTTMTWCPSFNLGVAVLTNTTVGSVNNPVAELVMNRFIESRFGEMKESVYDLAGIKGATITLSGERQKNYLGQFLYNRGGYMLLEWQDGRAGVNPGPNFSPLNFLSPEEFFFVLGGRPYFYRLVLDAAGVPLIVINQNNGDYLDLNERPEEPPGTFKKDWESYVGTYRVLSALSSPRPMEVRRKNGYLYIDYMKLSEHLPGLFFTAGGEAVDFRNAQPTWRNIKLQKASAQE